MNGESCIVCGPDGKVVSRGEANGFPMWQCDRCGLIWAGVAAREAAASLYDDTYFSNPSEIGYCDYLADEDNHRRNAVNLLRALRSYGGGVNGKTVMDIGCAYGFLLDEARRNDAAGVIGVEPSDGPRAYAKQRLGIDVTADTASSDMRPASVDVIFLLGTLEHLAEPERTIREMVRLLKEGGLLVVTTIDTAGPLRLYSLKPPEHLYYFNRRNLTGLLRKYGLETEWVGLYRVSYRLDDLAHRLANYARLGIFRNRPNRPGRRGISIRIPTNEMLLIARKVVSGRAAS